jgi:Uma2 family endonuclease
MLLARLEEVGPAMSSATLAPPVVLTTVDLVSRVGDIPLHRICFDLEPGSATEQDLLDRHAKTGRLYELVDGFLVEKPMGYPEGFLAATLIVILGSWVRQRKLGAVGAPDAMMRLAPGLVRLPDVSFVRWDRFPDQLVQTNVPVPDLVPDLAVEILSPSNTADEIARKRREYFGRGAQLVWIVDPRARTVEVFTAPTVSTLLRETDTLTGDPVLPGFTLLLRELFAELAPV